MLSRAQESIHRADLSSCVTTVHSPIQDLGGSISTKFDVITFHAVLEWLAEPKSTTGRLVEFLKRDGYLSVMFYNRNAALLKRILGGESDAALQESKKEYPPARWGNEATPLAEETVREWLNELGLRVRSKAGIRIFHDHITTGVRDRAQLDALLKTEKDLRKREPFASRGQHAHLVCEWAR